MLSIIDAMYAIATIPRPCQGICWNRDGVSEQEVSLACSNESQEWTSTTRGLIPCRQHLVHTRHTLLSLSTHSLLHLMYHFLKFTVPVVTCTWPLFYNAQPGRWLA